MKIWLLLSLVSFSALAQKKITKQEFSLLMTQAFHQMTGKMVQYAEPKCSVDTDYDYNWLFSDVSLHMDKPTHKAACGKIDNFLNILSKMDKILSTSMKTNSHFHDINIVLQKKFDNAFYSKHLGEVITMPQVFYQEGTNGKSYSKHPKYLTPIVMHEYAHYIIEKNLGPIFNKFISKHKDSPTAYLIRGGIHELLADIFAVTLTGDSEVIKESLHHVGVMAKSKYGQMSTRLRSFGNHENSLKAIGTRLRSLGKNAKAVIGVSEEGGLAVDSKSIEVRVHFGVHNLLTPTRYHVYKHYLSNPRFNTDKGRLIQAVMKVVAKKLLTLDAEGFRQAAAKDGAAAYVKLNNIFIEAIDSI